MRVNRAWLDAGLEVPSTPDLSLYQTAPVEGGTTLLLPQQRKEHIPYVAGRLARMGGWEVDWKTRRVTWSDELFWLHELPLGEQLSMDEALQFYVPEHRERIVELIQRSVEHGELLDFEAEMTTARARRIWVRVIGEAVRDAEGRVVKLHGAFQDLSDRKRLESSLLASESRLQQLAEAMPLIVWSARADGQVDFFNHHFYEFSGLAANEFDNSGWAERLHPDDQESCVAEWTDCVRAGRPFEIEHRMRRKDGVYRWLRMQATPIRDEHGVIQRWFGTGLDIHEVKQIAERLTSTLESLTDAFMTLDREWRVTYINGQAEQLVGKSRQQLLGEVLWEHFPQARSGAFAQGYQVALAEQRPVTVEEYSPVLQRWLEVRAYPSCEGLAIYIRDISDSKLAQAHIAEQAALIDQARDAIVVRDLEHRITFWNKGAERTYGWSALEAVGKIAPQLHHPDREVFLRADREVREQGEWSGEMQKNACGGARLWVDARWTLLRHPDGSPRAILSIDSDITQAKLLEQQFLRAQRLESIGTLAGGIAHDLNNVLAPIIISMDYLSTVLTAPEDVEVLDMITISAQRGADMVRQVLTFARGMEGQRMEVQLASLLKETEQFLRDTFPKQIDIELRLPPELPTVIGDPTQLHQILVNLCVNARDAMPTGGRLRLHAEQVYAKEPEAPAAGNYVRVSVEDTGSGISPDHLEKIYDPFFTTKAVGEGTGLGLSTSQAIVKGHGGFFRVSSELGQGTRFQVFLPSNAATSANPADTGCALSETPLGQGQLVLVVDDEAGIRQAARRALESHGYRALLAADGGQAIDCFTRHQHEIAAVVTDLMMPVLDGLATVTRLRQIRPELPIIAASGLGSEEQERQLARLGVTHFLPKPYSAKLLLQSLQELLT